MSNPEDSMEPIQPKSVQTITNEDQVDRLFSQALNLSDDLILHEPTCALCSSPSREDIEQKYLETKDYKATIKLCKDLTGLDLSKGVVENHMRYHYDRAIKEIQMREYIDRIKRVSASNLTTLDRLSICFGIITERVMGINSIVPSDDESPAQIEKIKSSETARLMGTLNSYLKLQASILGEMKSSGELISIPTNDFIHIINNALQEAQTDRERQLVKSILDQLDALSRKAQ